MTRAEFIMAQVDLEPIESHGSAEMSTNNFRSVALKTFNNNEDDVSKDNNIASAKSSFSSQKPPQSVTKLPPSKYKLLDLTEESMRDFALS